MNAALRDGAGDPPPLKASSIGLFDSGLGGLTVLRELRAALPFERYVYLGDCARTPYGNKGVETIVRYSRECAEYLWRQEIKLLVVACNTASSAALEILEIESPCPVIGTIDPAVRAALAAPAGGAVGVIGTEATIASGVYQRRLAAVAPGRRIIARACPLFVPLVEQGMFDGPIVEQVVEHYLGDLRQAEMSALILGCTHYPLLAPVLSRFFSDSQVKIVECSKAVAETAAGLLAERGALSAEHPEAEDRFFVTDAPQRFDRLASVLLGSTPVESINIGTLRE